MVFIFLAELIVLFFLSRVLTKELSQLFYLLFKSQKIAVILLAILFLPGTVIHEFSHAIMAKFLFVYVGKMELMPQLRENTLKLGSVEVGKTDIVRNFFIGVAPFISGVALILATLYITFSNDLLGLNIISVGICYFLFVISNTMFSSKKDMEGAIEFFALFIAIIVGMYFLGVRVPYEQLHADDYFKTASIFLGVPLVLDIAFIIFAKLVTKR